MKISKDELEARERSINIGKKDDRLNYEYYTILYYTIFQQENNNFPKGNCL